MPVGVRGWDTVMSGRSEVRKGWPVWSTADVGRGEGRLQLVICCSARDGTEEVGLREQRDRRGLWAFYLVLWQVS